MIRKQQRRIKDQVTDLVSFSMTLKYWLKGLCSLEDFQFFIVTIHKKMQPIYGMLCLPLFFCMKVVSHHQGLLLYYPSSIALFFQQCFSHMGMLTWFAFKNPQAWGYQAPPPSVDTGCKRSREHDRCS